MNNIQEILLFPVRDAEARKQFLITSAILLLSFIIPLLPAILVMGYTAKIMRQIIEEKKSPTMPAWQGNDLSEMFLDGLRIYGAQLVLMLPLFLLMGCGITAMAGGSIGVAALAQENSDLTPLAILPMAVGILFFSLFALLSLPYSVVISAALPHVAVQRSFQAAFAFQEWFSIFRKALGQFIIGYAIIMLASLVFAVMMQIAMITIILICIIPILMMPYAAYQLLVMNSVFAQAYAAGRDGLQPV